MYKFIPLTYSIIQQGFAQSPQSQKLQKTIAQSQKNIALTGTTGSALSFILADAFKKAESPFLLLFNDKEEAAYYLNDLEQFIGEKEVLFYPGSYRRPYQIEETDNANVLLRAEVLNRVNSRRKPAVIVTYPDAIFEKVVTRKELEKNTLKIKVDDTLTLDFLNEVLFEYKFKRVDFVTEPGEFSVRGGIVDVFSFSHDRPYRIEFFGDEVDSIRTFDVETQLSLEKISKITIIPNVENKLLNETRESFFKYIAKDTVVYVKNLDFVLDRLDTFFAKAITAFSKLSEDIKHAEPLELFVNAALLKKQLGAFRIVTSGKNASALAKVATIPIEEIVYKTKPQPSFNKKFDLLIQELNGNNSKGYTNYIFCATDQQAQRFHDIFDEAEEQVHYKTIVFSLHQGFINENLKIACYTDHQIFERYHKFHLKNGYAKKQAITLKELTKLDVGDYVTHIDHGIGKFGGLQKIDVEGKKQEAIKLMYGERDILYVSIHSLHKISKFTGKDGNPPKIFKLGSAAWKKLKQKTKSSIYYEFASLYVIYSCT